MTTACPPAPDRWAARIAAGLDRPETRWRAAAIAAALLVVAAAKHGYSHASAGQLALFLSPTAHLVSLVSGADFVAEAGAGWVSRELGFIIAPGCAGVNFALAAFLALTLGWLGAMRTGRDVAARLAAAAALAYAATLVVNTARIAIAIALHRGAVDLGGLTPGDVHRIEGVVVYLGGLCALYRLAGASGPRSGREERERDDRSERNDRHARAA
ncbi:MAG TPA: exosortase K [Kofleriaceae bacterium]|nr:exosortase K [Kofleriaceae bacterium]